MKYANKWFWVLLPLLFGGLVACDDSNATDPIPDPVDEAEVLVDYLEATRNYNVQGGFVIKAKDVHTNVVTEADQYVIDIRAASDFATGLRDALREDPDVLLIGEMRDPEAISLALTAAETGQLVLTSLHSRSTASACSAPP